MGESALKSHMKSQKHRDKKKVIDSLNVKRFFPSLSTQASTSKAAGLQSGVTATATETAASVAAGLPVMLMLRVPAHQQEWHIL